MPVLIPHDYSGDEGCICFVPLGDHYPAIPRVGSMCVQCCTRYDATACRNVPKVDPVTRLPMRTCAANHIVHRFNFLMHVQCTKTMTKQ